MCRARLLLSSSAVGVACIWVFMFISFFPSLQILCFSLLHFTFKSCWTIWQCSITFEKKTRFCQAKLICGFSKKCSLWPNSVWITVYDFETTKSYAWVTRTIEYNNKIIILLFFFLEKMNSSMKKIIIQFWNSEQNGYFFCNTRYMYRYINHSTKQL